MAQQSTTSRRAMLGILATGPIAMLPPMAAYNMGNAKAAGITPTFADLLAQLAAARHASEHFGRTVHTPTEEAMYAAQAAIPHVTAEYIAVGGPRTWSTERPEDVAMAHAVTKDGSDLRRPLKKAESEWHRKARRIVRADHKRQQEIARIEQDFKWEEIDNRYNALSAAWADAVVAVVQHPVSNLAELNAKFSVMEDEDWFGMDEGKEAIIADVRRLAGEA